MKAVALKGVVCTKPSTSLVIWGLRTPTRCFQISLQTPTGWYAAT